MGVLKKVTGFHLNRKIVIILKKIKFLVLDEADRLLEKSFEEDLEVSMDMLYNECGFLKVFSCKGIIKLFLAFIITALYMKMFEKLLVC